MNLSIPQIVQALRISRSEFGRIFLQAQMDLVQNGEERQPFEAVTHSGIDQDAYAEALTWADQKHFLDIMVRAIAAENLEDGSITAALTADAAATSPDPVRKAALQAITDLSKGFLRPEVFFRGVNIGMRWTVKIMVDGAFQGTGILIGPHLVLTAWHVVQSLFDPDTDPNHKNRFLPKTNGGAGQVHTRLSVEFDDLSAAFDNQLSSVGPKRFQAHVQWCAIHSECHPDELKNGLPADLTELDGFWDYAVLRLAKTPGLERRWAALDARAVVPAANARILVFQYPAGQPMRFDENVVAPAPAATAAGVIPRLRFLHKANAVGGSSGSPCFDNQFMLFGLHQGTWVRPAGAEVVNRGVPIIRIKEHIQQSIRELPVPDPSESPVWKRSSADPLRPEGPIVGCDTFQSLVWRSAVAGSPRFILVTGADRSGKTFRLSVLATMLPDGGHLKVGLRAEAISKLGAMDLAKEMCKAAGAAVPAFVQAADFNSSAGSWVRDELVQKVIQALDGVRSGRLVWLTIAELNRNDIQGEQASDFLLSLYEQVRTVDWLRIVLDDMKGDAPSTLRAVTERHRLDNVTKGDIEDYLSRAIAEFETPQEGVVRAFAGVAFKQYERWLNDQVTDPMDRLSGTLTDMVEQVLEN